MIIFLGFVAILVLVFGILISIAIGRFLPRAVLFGGWILLAVALGWAIWFPPGDGSELDLTGAWISAYILIAPFLLGSLFGGFLGIRIRNGK